MSGAEDTTSLGPNNGNINATSTSVTNDISAVNITNQNQNALNLYSFSSGDINTSNRTHNRTMELLNEVGNLTLTNSGNVTSINSGTISVSVTAVKLTGTGEFNITNSASGNIKA